MLKGFEFDLLYKEIKASVKMKCGNVRYFNKDTFKQILECIKSDDYTPMQNTDLYNKNSVCYCILLETISQYNISE